MYSLRDVFLFLIDIIFIPNKNTFPAELLLKSYITQTRDKEVPPEEKEGCLERIITFSNK